MMAEKNKGSGVRIEVIDGIFRVSYDGHLNEATALKIIDAQAKYAREQREKKLPAVALFDLSRLKGQSTGARRAIKSVPAGTVDRIALTGGSLVIRLAAQYLVRASNIDTVTKFFRTKRLAIAWLKRKNIKDTSIATMKKPRFSASTFIVPSILILVLGLTTISWYQAKEQLHKDVQSSANSELATVDRNLGERLNLYVNILGGFKAFFESNETVNQAQFYNYFNSLDLKEKYPGFSVFIYVKKVPANELAQFVKDARSDKSYPSKATPNFTITPTSNSATYYPILYSAQGSSTRRVEGVDLGQTNLYIGLIQKAEQTGQLAASDTIDLNGANSKTKRPGFFIILPVYKDASSRTPQDVIGYVSATFEHKLILNNLSDDNGQSAIRIYDDTSNALVFQDDTNNVLGHPHNTQSVTYSLGGKHWKLELSTPPEYGVNDQENNLPIIIAVAGAAVAALLALLFVSVLRGRRRAMRLAEDITEDLRQERNDAVSLREKDEAILSSIGDAVFAIDIKGNLTLLNNVAAKLSGYTREEALGRPYKEILPFLHEATQQINDEFITRALSGKLSSMKNHTVLIRKDGTPVPVADSAAPIRNANNDIIGVIVVFRDVSKEQELDRAKTEFVSLASHQLRTPLSAINWYGEMLLEGDAGEMNKDQHEYVKEIFEGSQRMSELVNSFLDVSRLEVGKMVTQPEPTDVRQIVDMLHKELAMQMGVKQIVLKQDLTEIPRVNADPKQLTMIVQNLLSNAVKYTDEKGTVEITLRIANETERRAARVQSDEPYWLFSVKDDGYGIPVEQQPKIFSKLFRADNVRRLDVEGTGLGLYIVKEVVSKMGGTVWFDSVENKGTTFYVVAPFKAPRVKK